MAIANPSDISGVTDANANAAATMQLLNAEATRFAIEMQGLNAQKDVADDIKRF
jgi:heptaprenylglyceryl phosphate synthase